jgi:hypothetical protein
MPGSVSMISLIGGIAARRGAARRVRAGGGLVSCEMRKRSAFNG